MYLYYGVPFVSKLQVFGYVYIFGYVCSISLATFAKSSATFANVGCRLSQNYKSLATFKSLAMFARYPRFLGKSSATFAKSLTTFAKSSATFAILAYT